MRWVMRRYWKTARAIEIEWNRQWGDLAQYNSEVARGIVHTPEWKTRMALKQEQYNAEILTEAEAQGRRIIILEGTPKA